jgi:hypothetical protein
MAKMRVVQDMGEYFTYAASVEEGFDKKRHGLNRKKVTRLFLVKVA